MAAKLSKKLFLLDGMALVYRAHFAFVNRPMVTAKGVNTSALFGFTQTLLDIVTHQQPTHIAVAFDTSTPTHRHEGFAAYKADRQVMPEDISAALPHVRRMLEAFNIPVLTCEGFEADDIIGTLVRRAEQEGFTSYMVTMDKDFGQLVSEKTFLYKVSRMGDAVAIYGLPEIRRRWGIERPEQIIDIIALWGDVSDNIPGVPGIGEKTAIKLIAQYGNVENMLEHTGELKGRVKENLEKHRSEALLSKKLATIHCDVPISVDLESFKARPPDEPRLKELLIEFEFNSIGRRLFGEEFKSAPGERAPAAVQEPLPLTPSLARTEEERARSAGEAESLSTDRDQLLNKPTATRRTLADVPHYYETLTTAEERAGLIAKLTSAKVLGFALHGSSPDPKAARLPGVAFSSESHNGAYVPLLEDDAEAGRVLEEFRPVLEAEGIEKVGHNLKYALSALRWRGLTVRGKLFDTMIAQSVLEPELRSSFDYLCESYLGYRSLPAETASASKKGRAPNTPEQPPPSPAERAAEAADLNLQLQSVLLPLLKEKGQERVFHEIESPLLPVLVEMEFEGIRIDGAALAEFAAQLSKEIVDLEKTICRMAGREFNLNSPRQLGEVLFDVMRICDGPKKTKTGQYATDERTLLALAPEHEIVRLLLEHRGASKLKSTYADALPAAIWPKTGRVHTTYNQVMTATGRLNSQDPNLQNIPINRERGQEIRKAFVPRGPDYLLLAADYSQIELRILASLSAEPGLLEALNAGLDVHTATAAKVYGVTLERVTDQMRRKAKMVNYGIAYGISPFGLSQRLNIPREEGAAIIEQYFKQFPLIRQYMNDTIAFARRHGFVETVTGRRRYIRDIRSLNKTLRGAAERNAINAPIQGTAADMIKLAMIHIQRELDLRKAKTRMLLQVHDELVFDLHKSEEKELVPIIEEKMKTAIALDAPIVVEMGVGQNWLEAH
jgi:DNA polymerase-1